MFHWRGGYLTREILKELLIGIEEAAKEKGIKNIWIQQMSESEEALRELEGTDINYIHGKCIMMFSEPDGMHKFHRGIIKFFGRLPK